MKKEAICRGRCAAQRRGALPLSRHFGMRHYLSVIIIILMIVIVFIRMMMTTMMMMMMIMMMMMMMMSVSGIRRSPP